MWIRDAGIHALTLEQQDTIPQDSENGTQSAARQEPSIKSVVLLRLTK